MACEYRNHVAGSLSGEDNDGYVIPAEPTGSAENDIMLLSWVGDSRACTVDASWNLIYQRDNTTNIHRTRLWWQRRGSSALTQAQRTLSWSGGMYYHEYILVAYSGCKTTGNPWTDTPTTASGTSVNPANPDPPSITTTISNALVVVFGMGFSGVTTGNDWGTPSGYTKREGSVADQASWSLFDKVVASPTTENPATITGANTGSNGWDAITIALEPAAGGGSSIALPSTGGATTSTGAGGTEIPNLSVSL